MTYHVTCNTDDNYAQHCCAMLCSLLENNKDSAFHVHILAHKLSKENTGEINRLCQRYNCENTIYEVDESRLDGVRFRQEYPLSKAAYYRILLPEILNEDIDKVLYLDSDIIVLNNIIEIYDIVLDNYALAACVDSCPYNSHHRNQLGLSMTDYAFCSGVMMINLKYWREYDAVNKLLVFSKNERRPIYLHDQDALNYVFKKQWLVLPPKWNRGVMSFFQKHPGERLFDFEEYDSSPKLIHYANHMIKPWFDVCFPERNFYITYLKLSGFKNVKFNKRTFRQKLLVYKASAIYMINKYIHPFIPNFIELIIKDIYDLTLMFVYLITNSSRLKTLMLQRRISKH